MTLTLIFVALTPLPGTWFKAAEVLPGFLKGRGQAASTALGLRGPSNTSALDPRVEAIDVSAEVHEHSSLVWLQSPIVRRRILYCLLDEKLQSPEGCEL